MGLTEDVRSAGILGAGGGGFPAHIKYGRRAEILIINGAECEPLAQKDFTLLQTRAADVITAAAALRDELASREVFLAVKETKARQLASLYGGVKIRALSEVYPAGDEALLVYDVTGRRVPAAGIPPDVGVVVANVETVVNVARALRGRPVTTTWVTVAGALREPFTAEVPVGATAAWLLEQAGGVAPGAVVFEGGPMMGREIEPATFGIGQQTGQITALPAGNVVVERYRHPLQHVRTIAGTACTQCKDCTELCPRYLLGYDVTPHLSMRRFFSWGDEPSEEWFGNAAGCTGCGLCELYACPMAISPRRVQDHLKTVLTGCERKEGGGDIHPDRSGRLVPAARLKRRTDIVNYDVEASLRELPAPGRAITSLTQPYGRVLEVLVKEGDKVEVGQPLARPAAGDETSVPVYAGVPGRVSETSSSSVVIDRGGAA